HAVVALLMVGLIIGHIYIGTIGMQGAFSAMWSGRVDRNWAREHHSLWYRQIETSDRRDTPKIQGRATSRSAVGTFAAGAVLALLLAVATGMVYRAASITHNEKWARPSVHLESQVPSRAAERR